MLLERPTDSLLTGAKRVSSVFTVQAARHCTRNSRMILAYSLVLTEPFSQCDTVKARGDRAEHWARLATNIKYGGFPAQ